MFCLVAAAVALSVAPAPKVPMVRFTTTFELRTWEPESRKKLDAAQLKWVSTYEELLRTSPVGNPKAEELLFQRLEQSLVPVQVVRASGWSDGGHRQLTPMLFVVDADVRVVRTTQKNLDEDGYHQRFSEFRACKPELSSKEQALFDKPITDFEAKYAALQKELCEPLPLRASVDAAKKAGKVDAAYLKDLAALLAILAESASGARVVPSAAELGDAKLSALLKGVKTNEARWVDKPATVSPFVATPTKLSATGTLIIDEGSLTSWLKRFELEADGDVALVVQALAHSVTYIE